MELPSPVPPAKRPCYREHGSSISDTDSTSTDDDDASKGSNSSAVQQQLLTSETITTSEFVDNYSGLKSFSMDSMPGINDEVLFDLCTGLEFDDLFDLCTGLEFDDKDYSSNSSCSVGHHSSYKSSIQEDNAAAAAATVTTGAFEFFHPCNAYSTGGMMSNATLDKYYHIRNFEVYGMQ